MFWHSNGNLPEGQDCILTHLWSCSVRWVSGVPGLTVYWTTASVGGASRPGTEVCWWTSNVWDNPVRTQLVPALCLILSVDCWWRYQVYICSYYNQVLFFFYLSQVYAFPVTVKYYTVHVSQVYTFYITNCQVHIVHVTVNFTLLCHSQVYTVSCHSQVNRDFKRVLHSIIWFDGFEQVFGSW